MVGERKPNLGYSESLSVVRARFEDSFGYFAQKMVRDFLGRSLIDINASPMEAHQAIAQRWGSLVADLLLAQFGVAPIAGPGSRYAYSTRAGKPYKADVMIPHFQDLSQRLLDYNLPNEVLVKANEAYERGMGDKARIEQSMRNLLDLSGPGYKQSTWASEVDRLVRTETQTLWNQASYESMLMIGSATKTWLTRRDTRVRPTHSDVLGTTVQIDEPFMVGGSAMMYPGDPNGAMSERENCRCEMDTELSEELAAPSRERLYPPPAA